MHYSNVYITKIVEDWTIEIIFSISTKNSDKNGVDTCQHKVVFDKSGLTKSFYWHPASSVNGIYPTAEKISLPSEGLFNQSDLAGLPLDGKKTLTDASNKIKSK